MKLVYVVSIRNYGNPETTGEDVRRRLDRICELNFHDVDVKLAVATAIDNTSTHGVS